MRKGGKHFALTGGNEQPCAHEIIIKDMCGNCGKDLRMKGGFSGDRTEHTTANVAMIHHVPELVVSADIANQLGARDHENILRQRKLILLVDLDQTLVHTTNKLPKPDEHASMDMFRYHLFGNIFYTKIRPYTRNFLEHLNKFYEMHIVTFGQRLYAHKIVELLDPKRIYFDYRVLSRDELLSSMHKTGNLKALFPCSEQLILMLDDRPDVWMHSEALIRIKPYRYFSDVGDINAPSEEMDNPTSLTDEKIVNDCKFDKSSKTTNDPNANEKILNTNKDENGGLTNENLEKREQGESINTAIQMSNDDIFASTSNSIPSVFNNDNALEHIQQVLIQVHSLFYKQFDFDPTKLPDVKRIISWFRSQVLQSEQIVFSGIMPTNVNVQEHEITRLCNQFGAKVSEKITEQTTVLIAGLASTEKVKQATRLRIPIVTFRWLDACFERWQKVDKNDFLFSEEEDFVDAFDKLKKQQMEPMSFLRGNSRTSLPHSLRRRFNQNEKKPFEEEQEVDNAEQNVGRKRTRLSGSFCLDGEMDMFAQMDTLGKQALEEMEKEVESTLSEEENDECE